MSEPDRPDPRECWDLVVVGAGAAGLTAACAAAAAGCSVLLLEQAGVVGGTSAISGGMVWLPANGKTAEAGRPDSIEAARTYLGQTVPGAHRDRLEAFLSKAGEVLREIEARTSVRFQPVMNYPDYYPDLPGATAGGRVLEPVPFDARLLGPVLGHGHLAGVEVVAELDALLDLAVGGCAELTRLQSQALDS